MNDTKQQPEALRLADWLEDQYDPTHHQEMSAAELRRLHDLIVKADTLARNQAARIAELEAAGAPAETLPLTMCADQHCPEYGTCYRAQAKPTSDQRFWAVSPREENSCIYYAPIYFTNGATAMKDAR